MQLLKLTASGLPLFQDKFEVDLFAEQKVMADDRHKLSNLFGSIFANQVIAIVGLNASGKTSLLKVLSFAFQMLNADSVNEIPTRDILSRDATTRFEMVFWNGKNDLYKLVTQIQFEASNGLDGRFVIAEESLYRKKTNRVRAKQDLVVFLESDCQLRRNHEAEFLKDDVSIVISVDKKKPFLVRDLRVLTNANFLPWSILRLMAASPAIPREVLEFLDPTIEELRIQESSNEVTLKFYGRDPIELSTPLHLENYLSSGTMKGINVFLRAIDAFVRGGYLMIDELENHFNREIVASLIRFFKNQEVNQKGATLIFSTHYSELLDEMERSDSIYIVRNQGKIEVQKLSKELKRHDIKKSEVYKSGYLGGTAPEYDAYIRLKKAILNRAI